jgi:type II secretory pathway pseudopilin PulG
MSNSQIEYNYSKIHKYAPGVTMVELVFVVSLIGIISAMLVGVINIQRQRQIAQDAALRANLYKVCSTIEAYYEGENLQYPAEGVAPTNRNPLDASAPDQAVISFYLRSWPSDDYVYNSTLTAYSVHVKQSINDHFYKCNNISKNVMECASTTDQTDTDDCDPIP